MADLRQAAQQALEALDWIGCSPEGYDQMCDDRDRAQAALRKALAQEEQATGKNPLQVDPKGGMQIATPLPLTTTDLAWLETRRLVRVWQELGQIRWAGADQGWDRAIEAVRARLDKECQDVLAWKERRESQGLAKEDIAQNLQSRLDAAKLLEERRQEITQPRREWRGLTDEEIRRMGIETPGQQGGWNLAFARTIEQALKEKNNG